MTRFGKFTSASLRSFIAAPLCGTLLVFGCGNGAAPDRAGAASPSNAGRGSTESNQASGDLPAPADRSARAKQPRVIGYLPAYRLAANPALHLDTLTHLNLAFAIPDSHGKVDFPDADSSTIQRIVLEAHESKVKVLAAIAGASGGKATSDRLALGVDAFVTSLLELVEKYHLDGIDVDIEGDDIDPKTYGPLMQALSKRLAEFPERKLLTAAVGEYQKDRYQALGTVDFLNIMSYDQCGSWSQKACEHSTVAQAQVDLDYWSSVQSVDAEGQLRTIGTDNVVLGVPFYGRCWGAKCPMPDGASAKTVDLSYAEILANCASSMFSGCSQSADVLKSGDEISGYYVSLNSRNTIKNKSAKAKDHGGIMIWELGQDDSNAPLFAEIAKAFPKEP